MRDLSACGEGVTVVRGANFGTDVTTLGVSMSTNSLIFGGQGNSGRTVLIGTETSSNTVESYAGVCRGLKRTVGTAELVTTTTVSAKVFSAGAEGSVERVAKAEGSRALWAMDERLWMGGNKPDSVTCTVGV